MRKEPASQESDAPLSWADLSSFAHTCIEGGVTADVLVQMAYTLLETAADMRRAGLGGEMARA